MSDDDDDDGSFDLHMQFALHEISLAQYRAQLKDLGWTDDEIDEALDDKDGEELDV